MRRGENHRCKASAAAGFTLIELLCVLVIVAILALIAVPNMTANLVRSQIFQSLSLATIAEGPVAAEWLNHQTFPADNAAAGLPAPSKLVSATVVGVTVQDGAVNLTFGNSVNPSISGKVVTLRPAVVQDTPITPVVWVCAGGAVPGGMTLYGVDQTSVPLNLLPLSCRTR